MYNPMIQTCWRSNFVDLNASAFLQKLPTCMFLSVIIYYFPFCRKTYVPRSRGFWKQFQPLIAPVNALKLLNLSFLLASKTSRNRIQLLTYSSNIDWIGIILVVRKWSRETQTNSWKNSESSDSPTFANQISGYIWLTFVYFISVFCFQNHFNSAYHQSILFKFVPALT